jgi:drug/metabolite transporter (DMT)-like permease
MINVNSLRFAYFELAMAQVSVAINTIVAKTLIPIMPAFLMLAIRFSISGTILLLIMSCRRMPYLQDTHPTGRLEPMDYLILSAQGLSAGVFFNLFFAYGVAQTTAISAGIISSILPAMVAIFAFILLKEKISVNMQFAIVIAMIGIVILSLNDQAHSATGTATLLGDFLVFIAIIPEALYSIFARLSSRRVSAMGAGVWANWTSALCLWPIAIYTWPSDGWQLVTDWKVLAIIGTGGVSAAGFYVFWPHALKLVPTSTAGIFGSLMPIATTFLAWIFLGEVLGLYDAIGLCLVLFSIYLGTVYDGKRKKRSP